MMGQLTSIAAAWLVALGVPLADTPDLSRTPVTGFVVERGTPGPCPDADGVTVVVDFQELGGDVVVRCAPGPTGTGLDALQGAGFQIEGVRRWGDAFICRIENVPAPGQQIPVRGNEGYTEQCIDTPPAAGYWSYWHADNGGAWTYSQWGVKNRSAIPGGFEGWSFSLNATADTNPAPRYAPFRADEPAQPSPSAAGPTTRPPRVEQPGAPAEPTGGPTPSDPPDQPTAADEDWPSDSVPPSATTPAQTAPAGTAAPQTTPSATTTGPAATRPATADQAGSTDGTAGTAAWTGELGEREPARSGDLLGVPWSVWATAAMAIGFLALAALGSRRRALRQR